MKVIFAILVGIVAIGAVAFFIFNPLSQNYIQRSKASGEATTINWGNPFTKSRTSFLQLNYKSTDGTSPVKMRIARTLGEVYQAPILEYQPEYPYRLEVFTNGQAAESASNVVLNKTVYVQYLDDAGNPLKDSAGSDIAPFVNSIKLEPAYKEILYPESKDYYKKIQFMCDGDTSGKTYTITKDSCISPIDLINASNRYCMAKFGGDQYACSAKNRDGNLCKISNYFFSPKDNCGTVPPNPGTPPKGVIVRGTVFDDRNNNGVYDTGDFAKGKIRLALIKSGENETIYDLTKSTVGKQNNYKFERIPKELYGKYRVDLANNLKDFVVKDCSQVVPGNEVGKTGTYFLCLQQSFNGDEVIEKVALNKWVSPSQFEAVGDGLFDVNESVKNVVVDMPLTASTIDPIAAKTGRNYINYQCLGDQDRKTYTLGDVNTCSLKSVLLSRANDDCIARFKGAVIICPVGNDKCENVEVPNPKIGVSTYNYSGKCER